MCPTLSSIKPLQRLYEPFWLFVDVRPDSCVIAGIAVTCAVRTGEKRYTVTWLNEQVERGRASRFASAVSLFDALQERLQLGQDYHGLQRQAITTPLLLLDDVDKLKPSEFREETLYKLLNGRSVADLPLALSSNNPPDALVRWIGEAGRSRLMADLVPVEMAGPDYRLEGRS